MANVTKDHKSLGIETRKVTKCLFHFCGKSDLRKGSFWSKVKAKVCSVGKVWCEAAGHMTPAVRKQREINAAAQLSLPV